MPATVEIIRPLEPDHLGFVVNGTTHLDGGQSIVGLHVDYRPTSLTGHILDAVAGTDGRIRIISPGHGLDGGMRVRVENVIGTVEANGSWIVLVLNASEIELKDSRFFNIFVPNPAARWTANHAWRDVQVENPQPGAWTGRVDVNSTGRYEVRARLNAKTPPKIAYSAIETVDVT